MFTRSSVDIEAPPERPPSSLHARNLTRTRLRLHGPHSLSEGSTAACSQDLTPYAHRFQIRS
jgi:hypothetical protein